MPSTAVNTDVRCRPPPPLPTAAANPHCRRRCQPPSFTTIDTKTQIVPTMMDGFTSSEEDKDDVILCEPVGTGSPLLPLCSGVLEGYNYFGDLPNPDLEDNSPRSHKGDFAALFSHNARCSRRFSKQKKLTSSTLLWG